MCEDLSPSHHLIHLLGCGSFQNSQPSVSHCLKKQSENIHVSVVSLSLHLFCIYMRAGTLQGVSNFTRQIQRTKTKAKPSLSFTWYGFKWYLRHTPNSE